MIFYDALAGVKRLVHADGGTLFRFIPFHFGGMQAAGDLHLLQAVSVLATSFTL